MLNLIFYEPFPAISEAKSKKDNWLDPIHTEFMAILPNNLDITLVKSVFSIILMMKFYLIH